MSEAGIVGGSFYPQRRPERREGRFDRLVDGALVRRWRAWRTVPDRRFATRVLARESDLAALADDGLQDAIRATSLALRRAGGHDRAGLVEAFALVREVSARRMGQRQFATQIMAAKVVHDGAVAEMQTGEGKTLTATLTAGAAALGGTRVHVVTANDYLAERDAAWMAPVYAGLGLTVGHVVQGMQPEARRAAYLCDVTYCSGKEVAFDYLRDRCAMGPASGDVQLRVAAFVGGGRRFLLPGLDFAIVDEADSVMIDEARTPLILSATPAEAETDAEATRAAGGLARTLKCGEDFLHLPADRVINLTEAGRAAVDELAERLPPAWRPRPMREELLRLALSALHLHRIGEHYVVRDDKVEIVDEYTGRVMPDRSWSAGLHQAVEAKEGVAITARRETMAQMTYQRFFRRYRRLAGMTGTAAEAAGEFWSVYRLPVARIPTHRPSARRDLGTRVLGDAAGKWAAVAGRTALIAGEGRPVLIGCRTIAASEAASAGLRRAGIPHTVLSATQDADEAGIVARAGLAGAVTVATNMAGRGTDIKLQPIERAALVRHWQLRNMLPAKARPEMGDEELVNLSYRHQAKTLLGIKDKDIEEMSDAQIKLGLLRYWVATNTQTDQTKAQTLSETECMAKLDQAPEFMLHKLQMFTHVQEMGGLHIVGTERHEARRIDNQLRGRAGRQGDKGSSRFFIGLDDELMQMFAGPIVLKTLSRLGMKEGDAIEHRWITKSVERAQRKVEERNFEIRKQLVDYDEVMELQRNGFYSVRQEVLQGNRVEQIIFDYIEQSVADAVDLYLDRDYLPTQIAEWCRETLDVSVEPSKLRSTDADGLIDEIRSDARAEAVQLVEVTLGEYMNDDAPPEDWDTRGLSSWAQSKFAVNLSQNQIRQMSVQEVRAKLSEAAQEQIDKKDLTGVSKFLVPHYALRQLAEWAKQKFLFELDVARLAEMPREEVESFILAQARKAYAKRETEYPVDFVLDMAFAAAQQNGEWAAQQLCAWVANRYELTWTPEQITNRTRAQMRDELVAASEAWIHGDKIESLVDKAMGEHREPEALAKWVEQRLGRHCTAEELGDADTRREAVIEKARMMHRAELAQLERYVLLQILDSSWKDHLYAMDQLRDAVSTRSIADREKDPRVVYKREGASHFLQMQKIVRDRVTDLIFRARLTANIEARNVYGSQQQAQHAQAASALEGGARAQGSEEQEADMETARRAGGGREPMSRKQRRAAEAESRRKDRRDVKRRR